MPRGQRNPGTIDWSKSLSRKLVLDDLEEGIISLDETDTAEDLYEFVYKDTPEFIMENVGFQQFKNRLKDHRSQVSKRHEAAQMEIAALEHDLDLFPIRTHNDRGEKKFYLTEAYKKLAEDISEKKHETMTPSELKASRPEYAEWPLKIFDGRIRQAIRRARMVNWRNDKREAKEKKRREKREKLEEDLVESLFASLDADLMDVDD